MRKRNWCLGFTLIEVIAVVILLSIILLVSLPALSSTLKNTKEKRYQEFLNDLYIATEAYITMNDELFPQLKYDNGTAFINISELVYNNYINHNKGNPKTEEDISLESTIKVTKLQDKSLTYDYFDENYTNGAYVSDQLILMYDAYNLADDKIKDLKGTNDGVMVNFNNGWLADTILFDGVDDYISNNINTTSNELTFQFVLKYQKKDSNFYIFNKSDVNPMLMVNNNGYLVLNSSNGTIDYTNQTIMLTVTIDSDGSKLYLNNELVLSDEITDTSGVYRLFSNNGSNPYKGSLFATRIYEKSLTADELEINYKIDKGRYKYENN